MGLPKLPKGATAQMRSCVLDALEQPANPTHTSPPPASVTAERHGQCQCCQGVEILETAIEAVEEERDALRSQLTAVRTVRNHMRVTANEGMTSMTTTALHEFADKLDAVLGKEPT